MSTVAKTMIKEDLHKMPNYMPFISNSMCLSESHVLEVTQDVSTCIQISHLTIICQLTVCCFVCMVYI